MQIADKLRKSILQAAIQGKLTEQLPSDGDARDLLAEIKREKARLVAEKKMNGGKKGAGTAPLPPITDDELPFDIPENWCWVRLGEVIAVSSGKGLTQNEMHADGQYPVYGGNGINGNHSEWFVQKNTLVVGRVGYYCGCVHKVSDDCWVTDNALVVKVTKDIFHINYLQLLLENADLKSTSVATAQPVVSGARIYQQIIPVAPLAEQRRIVATIEALLPRIEALEHDEKQLAELQKTFPQQLKNSLLQAAIQGKLTEQLASDGDARDLLAAIKCEKARLVADKKMNGGKKGAGTALLPPITDDEMPFDIPDNWCWVRLGEVALLNPRNNIANDMQVS
ncbi:MAG: restriction endonuclease subunit S, partial [Bacillota bacterium]